MHRLLKKLLLLLGTLGLGALAYGLLKTEGEGRARPEPAGAAPADPRPATPRPAPPAPEGSPRCEAVTRSGQRCTREAQPGSRYCWQHEG